MEAIIIGGVAAGMSAASKLKRTLPQARIRVYERGNFLSYGACGIPYYVGGINADPDLLIARSREDFEKQGIQTFLRHEAVSVDPVRRQVRVRDLDSGREFEDDYDRLMIAVGCDSAVLLSTMAMPTRRIRSEKVAIIKRTIMPQPRRMPSVTSLSDTTK